MWENPFANALLKVERANKHIADIEERLRASAYSHGVSLHMNGQTGEHFLYYRPHDRTLRSDVALMVGDAVHNLHCALDIAWCGAVQALSPQFVTGKLKFPVDPEGSREKLVSSLTKGRKVPLAVPLVSLVADQVKTYKGGDADILALHQLDISDKHRLLIPMLTLMGVNGVELEHEDGTVDRIAFVLAGNIPWRRPIAPGDKIKENGNPTFRITFSEGDFRDVEVLPTLGRFRAKVQKIVRILQRMAV